MDLLASLNLWVLFLGSLIAPTSVPGTSEALLLTMAAGGAHPLLELLLVAALGNALGGGGSLLMGNLAGRRWPVSLRPGSLRGRVQAALERYGSPLLLLSWMPLVGDWLCVAAGWLRLSFWPSLAFIATGRLLRYAAVLTIFKATL